MKFKINLRRKRNLSYASTKAQSQRLSAQFIAEEMKSFDVLNLKHHLFSYKNQTTKHSGVKFFAYFVKIL
jgi:hypothetical protein